MRSPSLRFKVQGSGFTVQVRAEWFEFSAPGLRLKGFFLGFRPRGRARARPRTCVVKLPLERPLLEDELNPKIQAPNYLFDLLPWLPGTVPSAWLLYILPEHHCSALGAATACFSLLLPLVPVMTSTEAVVSTRSLISSGTSSSRMRTGTRCASRIHSKVGLI